LPSINRRERRRQKKAAQRAAKMNNEPQIDKPANAKQDSSRVFFRHPFFWSFVLFIISLGFRIIFPDTDSLPLIFFVWGLWGLTLALILVAGWRRIAWKIWFKAVLVALAAALFVWTAYANIEERVRPSFVFVSPGPLFNNDTWDLISNHRGSKTSYTVQILFQDQDRLGYLRQTQPTISPSDFDSEQLLPSIPEVNPMGRGSIFAQQFQWKPFNLNHSHFDVNVKWRDGMVHEVLEIAKVQDKWVFLMNVTDSTRHRILLACHDKDFPSTEPMPVCFPAFTEPGE
jgi:hypothetical protein